MSQSSFVRRSGCLLFTLLLFAVGRVAPVAGQEAKSPPEAVQIFQDAANFQNNNAFKLAVEEWEKFLKKFPQDPLTGKATHYLGICQTQLTPPDHEKAEVNFQAVVKNFPKLDMIQDAYLYLGFAQYSQGQAGKAAKFVDATATYEAMLKLFAKEGRYNDQALYFLGDSYYLQGKKKECVTPWAQLVKDFPKSGYRADALYNLGIAYEDLAQFAEAGPVYDLFLKEFDKHDLVTEVRMRKAETLLQTNKLPEAEKLFAEVAAVKDFASADNAIYRQAATVLKQNRFADAAALYAKVATDFPKSDSAKPSTVAAARAFYRGEKFAESAAWFQKVLAAGDADAPEAAHWICKIHLRNGKAKEAADLAAATLPKAAQSTFLVQLKLDQADGLYEQPAQRAASLDLYAKIAAEHATHELAPQALYNAAFTALDLKKYDDGLKHSGAFLAAHKEHRLLPDVKNVAAESNLQLGKHADAEKGFLDLATNHKDHPEIEQWRVRLGLCLYLQKKYPETVAALQPVVAEVKKPDNVAEVQYLIGASLYNQDKPDDALKALNASLAASPKWRQADETLLFISQTYRKQKKLDEAIAAVKKLIAEFPESRVLDRAHFRHGEYSYSKGDYPTAVAEYDRVIVKSADSVYAPFSLYGKGWGLLKQKQYQPGADAFTALVTKHPQHQLVADSQFARAMCRRQAGDLKGCVEDVNAFLKSNPDVNKKSDALYERGLAEVALKDNAAAVTTLAALLKENEKYEHADKVIYELAWAYKSQDKNDEAVANFAKLAAGFKDSQLAAESNFHVGESHYGKKDFAEASKSYTEAKTKAGKTELGEKSTYKLGWANYQLKQYDPALQQFSEQVTTYPAGPLAADGLFMKAECLFKIENHKEALPAFVAARKATDANPKTPADIKVLILLHGGQSAGQLMQWPESLKWLEVIPKDFKESPLLAEAYYEMGWAKHNQTKPDDALKDFEEAATLSRTVVGARGRFMIGEIHFEKKDHTSAIANFQRVMFGYGGANAPDDVKNWQAKAGFEAGRCAEVQIAGAQGALKTKAITDAKMFYKFVVDSHAKHELAAKAKTRLDELSKL